LIPLRYLEMANCVGNPTFDVGSNNPNRFINEWPAYVPGFVCKTPPIGRNSAPRFAQCCSGRVYNVTSATNDSDPEWPMTCALFCQVDPKQGETSSEANAPGLTGQLACLSDNGREPVEWEVECATNTAASGLPWPTSYLTSSSTRITITTTAASSSTTTGISSTTMASLSGSATATTTTTTTTSGQCRVGVVKTSSWLFVSLLYIAIYAGWR